MTLLAARMTPYRAELCPLEVHLILVCSPAGHFLSICKLEQRVDERTYPGWDPIFEYEGETYAEMDKAKKNKLSHRAIALSKLQHYVASV